MSNTLDDIKIENFPEGVPERKTCDDEPSQLTLSVQDQLIIEDIEDRKEDRELRREFSTKAYKVARTTLYGWAWVLAVYVFFWHLWCSYFP